MKKLLFVLTVFCAVSCVNTTKLEKPFMIINKSFIDHGSYVNYIYQYQDKNGEIREFNSNVDKYEVGDIIK